MSVRKTKWILATLSMAFALCGPSWASGRVRQVDPTFFAAWDVTWHGPRLLAPRDVVVIRRDGATVGEAVVISARPGLAIILPRTSLRVGDEIDFARPASSEVFLARGLRPAQAPTVVVKGRDSTPSPSPVESRDPASYPSAGAYPYGYGTGYGYYGFTGKAPTFNLTETPANPGHLFDVGQPFRRP
jgi:hypothetical protein